MEIFGPSDNPYGLTYAKYAENYWKWLLPIPAINNPVNDPTGEICRDGQENTNSSVFFLSGNGGGSSERVCNVPAGKGLLIPVMQVEISEKESPGSTIQEMSDAPKKDQDSVNSLYLQIDGKVYNYEDLLKFRTHTDAFDVVFANDGLFGVVEGGPTKAVADGFYIVTQPVSKGNHTIHFKSSLICSEPDCADPNFVQDVKYRIFTE